MGVYIKGMKMPKSCSDCLFCSDGLFWVTSLYDANDELCTACLVKEDNSPSGCGYGEIDGIDHTTRRMNWCPLVEVSEPHKKLVEFIDVTIRDDNSKTEETNFGKAFAAYHEMREAKPVIEAEGECEK